MAEPLPPHPPPVTISTRRQKRAWSSAGSATGLAPDPWQQASTRPWATLAEDLEVIAASPPAVVRAELDKVRDGRPFHPVLRPLYADPAAHLPEVVAALGRYWQAVLEPHWLRLRALSAADVTFRMERSASTSRSSRTPPWSPAAAAGGWCSTSEHRPPPPC